MNVKIDDAISALRLLRDHIKDNDYLWECYNLGVSALITIKDGDYQLKPMNVSRETLEEIAEFDCTDIKCSECKFDIRKTDYYHNCIRHKAQEILRYEQNIQEVEAWINQNLTK